MKKTILQLTQLKSLRTISSLGVFLLSGLLYAQTANVKGKIIDENHFPLEDVVVTVGDKEVYSDNEGNFIIEIPSNEEVFVTITQEGRLPFTQRLKLADHATRELIVRLVEDPNKRIELQVAEVSFQRRPVALQSIALNPAQMAAGPSLTGGVTDLLKTLPYVSSNTELSSQYMVRGGNYDENLIYVNGMEVYRPQLIRAGEQEGLGFVNPTMTQSVNFSAGGWEAKYGDKMSSVLDIYYKRPHRFEGQFEANMMGGSLTLGHGTNDRKFSAIVGGRYQNRNLILNTLDGDTDFNPKYFDVQTFLNYQINDKWNVNFLGTLTKSTYEMEPNTRETYFGSLTNPLLLTVFYDGREDDQFQTETGNLQFNYKANEKLDLAVDFFGFHSKEQEYFDIHGAYLISEVDQNGNATQTYDVGSQIDHARNNFDILVYGIQHKGKYKLNVNNDIEWGIKYQQEDVRDQLSEWQVLDSVGYSIPNQTNSLDLHYAVNARNFLKTNRFSGYAQYSSKFFWNRSKVMINAGLRATYWDYNEEFNISPRAQIAIKPDWDADILFRFASGIYYQPPFYREIRRLDGTLNDKVKAQQSIHFILGSDYEFRMMDRPFKLTTEVYYKLLNNLNPYYVDNVRVRYQANNNSEGYAYGIDARLFGEFVPGVDSWFSVSYARAYQNIDNRGNISLPTDPRFRATAFFQDYMPMFPSFKVNVNFVYASGLPMGSPQYADPYQYQEFLNDYKRVDIGFVKEFINEKDLKPKTDFWRNFKEVSVGLDVFNIFDIRNEISNTWVRDVNTTQVYSVPNRLTGRFFNAKINFKF
ncbi:TonB-dependent receptor plug domain-containing protein [Vaginella massiliensis]|uniref:TonB-dependent receptor plug domain-containing protein n=1 Tax=Vaginella massiliensis TaxID=1816680 RepID=UPI000838FC4E|nr:TonB-dependent receptor [Vaginella massiliensis]